MGYVGEFWGGWEEMDGVVGGLDEVRNGEESRVYERDTKCIHGLPGIGQKGIEM